MKLAALLVLSFLVSPALTAQNVRTFKGNRLGMSLDEFKRNNIGQKVWINTGDPSKRRNKKLDYAVDTPLCTDTFAVFPGVENVVDRHPGEVICNISPGAMNPAAKMIGDMAMKQIIYRFYAGKLYQIDLSFGAMQFTGVRSAFNGKFGQESNIAKVDCQNGFGARWTGDSVQWQVSPTVAAIVYEGCSNGPGQNSFDGFSNGSISDSSLAPPQAQQKTAALF